MRWLVSAVLAIAACGAPPERPRFRPACAAIERTCDPGVTDDAAFALVRRRCWGCHGADGLANHDFTSLSALRAAPIAEMIGTCQMPPDGERPLEMAERRMLAGWASCY